MKMYALRDQVKDVEGQTFMFGKPEASQSPQEPSHPKFDYDDFLKLYHRAQSKGWLLVGDVKWAPRRAMEIVELHPVKGCRSTVMCIKRMCFSGNIVTGSKAYSRITYKRRISTDNIRSIEICRMDLYPVKENEPKKVT